LLGDKASEGGAQLPLEQYVSVAKEIAVRSNVY
jgi:hypothetical protein